jgi:hypothetical protein
MYKFVNLYINAHCKKSNPENPDQYLNNDNIARYLNENFNLYNSFNFTFLNHIRQAFFSSLIVYPYVGVYWVILFMIPICGPL